MTDTCCYTYGGYNSTISAGRSGGCAQPRLLKFVVGPKKCNTGCTYIATNMGNVGAMENSDDPSFNNYSANKEYVDQGAKGVLVVKAVDSSDAIPTFKMMFEKGRNYHLAAEYDYQATADGDYTLSVTVVGLSVGPESVTIKTLNTIADQVIVNAIVTGDGKEHDVEITTTHPLTAVTDRVVKVKIYDVGNTKLA